MTTFVSEEPYALSSYPLSFKVHTISMDFPLCYLLPPFYPPDILLKSTPRFLKFVQGYTKFIQGRLYLSQVSSREVVWAMFRNANGALILMGLWNSAPNSQIEEQIGRQSVEN